MSRLPLSTGALLLTAVLALGVSTGPAAADGTDPPDASRPVPTDTTPPAEPPAPTGNPPAQNTPAPPDPAPALAAPGVDLRIAVVYEKPAYFAHEVVRARATVTNVGTATATGVTVTSTGNIDSHHWTGFGWPGVTLAPGGSAEGTASGYAGFPNDGEVRLTVTATATEPDTAPADNTVDAAVPLGVLRGAYSGVVYGDGDGNGAMDPGEALPGLEVRLQGGHPWARYTARTDANGRFSASTLPVGRYVVEFDGPTWWFPGLSVEVDDVDDPDVLIRGTHQVAGRLTATAAFTAPTYAVGDLAVMNLTVTNSGTAAIRTLKAVCYADVGTEADLGELGREDGTTLPGGTTKSYPVRYRITAAAAESGHLRVDCVLGAPPVGNGEIKAGDTARVPGARATRSAGRLVQGLSHATPCGPCRPPTAPLVGVKVYLRSQLTGQVVARAVTDPQGVFTFHDLPADLYDFGVVGPWKAPATYVVKGGDNSSVPTLVFVVAGPDQPDPDADPDTGPPPGGAPAPPGAEPDALARTGTGLDRLALTGVLLLLVGAALVTRAGKRA
ncbi:carboxypeptidase-like regulatory domain-containing protein [Actinosynnema sp. NPDC050436]|uniref:carboxypeptidase-like regulatory domain-containing protein n=1 Tax=Actinosynnema sp. NPDC050436 TaxID=3155659 RepID=UPI0034026FA4